MSDGVSVIVPVFGSWEVVHRTAAAVAHDCRSLGVPWELILVDNESDEVFISHATDFAAAHPGTRLIRRAGLGGRHFQPGAARNAGIENARYPVLLFLDADCIPAAGTIAAYVARASANTESVFIGRREFVSATGLPASDLAVDRDVLNRLDRVRSTSNYGLRIDRRMSELLDLRSHQRPYDVAYACNLACHADCVGDLRFDPVFDGHWGYEDIEWGYRLFQAGRRFVYVPEAPVFHQETAWLPTAERSTGRYRNFLLAGHRIPGFIAYRQSSPRCGAFPGRAAPQASRVT